MNLEQLANIVEVSKTKSLTEAAINRNITLPTLSQSLSHFEKEIDIKLFNRSRSGTLPTKDGQIIINIAREILEKIEILNENVQKIKKDFNGTFRLASLPGYMSLIMDAISDLNRSYPSIISNLFEGNTAQIYEKLLNQQIDIALIAFNEDEVLDKKEFIFEKITTCKTVIAVNKKSPLAKKKFVTLSDIKDYPIAIHDDHKILDIFSKYEKDVSKANIVLITNNVDSIRKSLSNNTAITFGLDYSFSTDSFFLYQEEIVLIDLVDPYPEKNYIGFARLNKVHYSEITHIVVGFIKEELKKYIQQSRK